MFRRGEAAADVRLLAAQGGLAPRAHEQVALLVLLSADTEAHIAQTANATIASLPSDALRSFLARHDVGSEIRQFFAERGVEPGSTPAATADAPLMETGSELPEAAAAEGKDEPQLLSSMPIVQRMKLAMKGTREQRAQLIRDSNRMVAAAVLSSPKLTGSEVEAFTKMGNVSEDVLRTIGMNRSWLKNYGVILGLVKNPKTPAAISMQLLNRLNEKDIKMLAVDRNVPEALRMVARKLMVKTLG